MVTGPDRYRRRHQPRLRSAGGPDSDPITIGCTTGPDTTSFAGTGAASRPAINSAGMGASSRSIAVDGPGASTAAAVTSGTSVSAGAENGGGPASIGTGLARVAVVWAAASA